MDNSLVATSSSQADVMMAIHDQLRKTHRGSYDTSSHIHQGVSVSPSPYELVHQAQQDNTMQCGPPGSVPRRQQSGPMDCIAKKLYLLFGSPAANTYRSPYVARTFPKFPDLPEELRLQIWKFAAGNQSRDVLVELNICDKPKLSIYSATPVPPMFHSCSESRRIALKMQVTIFEHHSTHPIYLNPATDVLFLIMRRAEFDGYIGHGLYALITGQSTMKDPLTPIPEPFLTQKPQNMPVLQNTEIALVETKAPEGMVPVLVIKPSEGGDKDVRKHVDRIDARVVGLHFFRTPFKPVVWWDEVWPIIFYEQHEVITWGWKEVEFQSPDSP